MSVNSVGSNNNNNSRPSIVPGAVVGGATIGAVSGYNSRPYIQKDDLEDSFVRKLAEHNQKINTKYAEIEFAKEKVALEEVIQTGSVNKMDPAMKRSFIADVEGYTKKPFKKATRKDIIDIAKARIEDNDLRIKIAKENPFPLLEVKLKRLKGIYIPEDATIAEAKGLLKDNAQILDLFPKKSQTLDELIEEVTKGKNVAEIKKDVANQVSFFERNIDGMMDSARNTFLIHYDGKNNKFILPEGANEQIKETLQMIKKEAKSLQKKTALAYGFAGAAILGVGTYLMSRFIGNSSK